MKNPFLALAAALALPLAAGAQSAPRNYVGLHVGASLPTGDYGKADFGNAAAGYAKTGLHLALDGAHYFGTGPLGVAAQLAFGDNGRLTTSELARMGDGFTDGFGVDESTISVNGRYRRLTAMVGPSLLFGEGKLKVEIRVLGGLVKSLGTPE